MEPVIVTNEEKAAQIAKETIQRIEAEKVEKAKEGKTPEQLAQEAKAEEVKAKEAEAKAVEATKAEEEVEALLDKEETVLTEEEKKKKQEIEANIKDEPVEKILNRHYRKTEKRINKLVSELKSSQERTVKEKEDMALEIAKLKQELSEIKQPQVEEQAKSVLSQAINKAIEEDSELPREQRREMTKDELNEWLLEDPSEAHEWMIARDKRREEFKKPRIDPNEKKAAEEFIKKQNESVERMTQKFPGTRPKERALELKGQGKTAEEIHQILLKENDEYRICDEILKADPNLFTKIDFGDVVAAEIEKRLKDKKEGKKLYTEEEVQKRIEEAKQMEAERVSRLDTGASHSTTKGANQVGAGSTAKKSDFLIRLEKEYVKAGLDPAKAAITLQRRAQIPGISRYHPSQEKDEE